MVDTVALVSRRGLLGSGGKGEESGGETAPPGGKRVGSSLTTPSGLVSGGGAVGWAASLTTPPGPIRGGGVVGWAAGLTTPPGPIRGGGVVGWGAVDWAAVESLKLSGTVSILKAIPELPPA